MAPCRAALNGLCQKFALMIFSFVTKVTGHLQRKVREKDIIYGAIVLNSDLQWDIRICGPLSLASWRNGH